MKNVNVSVKLNGKADMMVRPERSGEKVLVKAGETIVMKSDQATKLVRAYCQFEILGGTEEKVATAKKETKKEKQDRIKAEIQAEKDAAAKLKAEKDAKPTIEQVQEANNVFKGMVDDSTDDELHAFINDLDKAVDVEQPIDKEKCKGYIELVCAKKDIGGDEELIDFVVTAEFLEENKDNADLEGVAVGDTIKIPKVEEAGE